MEFLKTILKEPLLHFLIIGAAIFWIYDRTQEPELADSNKIVVSEGKVEQLQANFFRSWKRPPTVTELSELIDQYIRDELYYREAVAMGLDRGDPVINRRLRQKLGLLFDDAVSASQFTDDELSSYLQDNMREFVQGPEVSFIQVYFNPDKRIEPMADAVDARKEIISGGELNYVGDEGFLPRQNKIVSQKNLSKEFGYVFAEAVVQQKVGEWSEPIKSGYGVHLIFVESRLGAREPSLDEVKPQVEYALREQQRKDIEEATYQALINNYDVVIEGTVQDKLIEGSYQKNIQAQHAR